jgi:hypothetical protein
MAIKLPFTSDLLTTKKLAIISDFFGGYRSTNYQQPFSRIKEARKRSRKGTRKGARKRARKGARKVLLLAAIL